MGGDADVLIEVTKDFGTTFAEVRAWAVPSSKRYPEGVKYSMQYGTLEGDTIIRYDNFPDHPGVSHHHKHTEDGSVQDVTFQGLVDLFDRFKAEVRAHGESW